MFTRIGLNPVNHTKQPMTHVSHVPESYDIRHLRDDQLFHGMILLGTEWLSKNYRVDFMCGRIFVAKDSGNGTDYMVCSNVYLLSKID